MDIGVKEINKWHIERGFNSIGYHKVIRRNGYVAQGRHDSAVGAHAKGYNADSIGICLVGGINKAGEPENNFTNSQWASLEGLLKEYLEKYPKAVIIGHNEVSNKACPSFDVQEYLRELNHGKQELLNLKNDNRDSNNIIARCFKSIWLFFKR